jgi:uncharacterized damage-inducible protein DinB
MTNIDLLKLQTEFAYDSLLEALDGVTEKLSWAVLPNNGPDYLHSDGSIHGIALHVASCKTMYASACFRNTEIRWRDVEQRVASFEPNWKKAMKYFKESQDYWMECWKDLRDDQLLMEVKHPQGATKTALDIIKLQIQHDAYHAGQVAVIRYGCPESDVPPPSVAEDIRTYCKDSVSW